MPAAPPRNEPARYRFYADPPVENQGAGSLRSVNLGGSELIIILIIVLVLFGGAKLPKLARSLGQAQKEFKEGMNDEESDASPDDVG